MKQFLVLICIALLSACRPLAVNSSTSTSVPQTAAQTPTRDFTPIAATVMPTQPPIIMITPDEIQVERWKEYETALAKSLLPKESPEQVLCEWVILGQSGQELYVVAVCLGSGRATAPAVIYLDTDGSIQNMEIVEYGSTRDLNIQRLFPPDIREMIYDKEMQVIYERLAGYLDWRSKHREEPPLIILNITSTPTP
jgi:hypothetical protein